MSIVELNTIGQIWVWYSGTNINNVRQNIDRLKYLWLKYRPVFSI